MSIARDIERLGGTQSDVEAISRLMAADVAAGYPISHVRHRAMRRLRHARDYLRWEPESRRREVLDDLIAAWRADVEIFDRRHHD